MGLDVTAYANTRRVPAHPRDWEACDDAGHVWVFAYAGMEASYRGLANADVLGVFEGSSEPYIGGVCYDTSNSERHTFAAGSYGGYNAWRDELTKAFLGVDPTNVWNNPGYADSPFYELITFADNEGSIGPDAAKDLLADFEAGAGKWADYWAAKDNLGPYELRWAIEKYEDWTLACRLAAHGGLIHFH
jgi:hypothetical protein